MSDVYKGKHSAGFKCAEVLAVIEQARAVAAPGVEPAILLLKDSGGERGLLLVPDAEPTKRGGVRAYADACAPSQRYWHTSADACAGRAPVEESLMCDGLESAARTEAAAHTGESYIRIGIGDDSISIIKPGGFSRDGSAVTHWVIVDSCLRAHAVHALPQATNAAPGM